MSRCTAAWWYSAGGPPGTAGWVIVPAPVGVNGVMLEVKVAGGMDAGLETGLGEELRALVDPPTMEAAPRGMCPFAKLRTALKADCISGLGALS